MKITQRDSGRQEGGGGFTAVAIVAGLVGLLTVVVGVAVVVVWMWPAGFPVVHLLADVAVGVVVPCVLDTLGQHRRRRRSK